MIVSTAVPVKMRRDIRELHNLFVPEADRGNGYGAQLLHDVCREADEHKLTLLLAVDADKIESMVPWYTRWGFQPIQAKPLLMARMCGSTPRILKPLAQAIEAYH
jgi:N-acetylglutamate synthase-like GNAT family acetyltransferase